MRRGLIYSILAIVLSATVAFGRPDAKDDFEDRTEEALSEQDFQKLDTFEGHLLAKADKLFVQKDYRGAFAEYNSFMEQYPKSVAIAYVLLRKGRCLHLDNKRFEAVKAYTEVLDYFPNAVSYAGAALFYIGQCHFQNGDSAQAATAWTEMAEDEDYRKHRLAAVALVRLGDLFSRENKPDDAAKYYAQVAVDFRTANPDVARAAMAKAITYYVRTRPSESKLAEFYVKVRTFHQDPAKGSDADYWDSVRESVRKHGTFADSEKTERADYFRYWTGVMESKLPKDDDSQIALADFNLYVDGDVAKWIVRLDRQFAASARTNDYTRVIRWIRLYAKQKNKVQDYYAKLNFAQMTNGQIEELLRAAYESLNDPGMGRSAYDKLQQNKMNDRDRSRLVSFFAERDEKMMERVCADMTDKTFGRMLLLRHYGETGNAGKGIPLANELVGVPDYAKEVYWIKASLLQEQRKFAEAILAYQSADRPPSSLYKIADCYLGMNKIDQAVGQLREIENFFKNDAPEAAWRIAAVYKRRDNKLYVASLRGIMAKYPASRQSNAAHEELERMGIKIGGGVDAK